VAKKAATPCFPSRFRLHHSRVTLGFPLLAASHAGYADLYDQTRCGCEQCHQQEGPRCEGFVMAEGHKAGDSDGEGVPGTDGWWSVAC